MPISQLPTSLQRQRFRRRLFTWYRKHGRDLPWRHTNNPYHILVSEVMLQQTQVERVLPKYHEWLTKYPSLSALADAPIKKVVSTWRPLGYNVRHGVYMLSPVKQSFTFQDAYLQTKLHCSHLRESVLTPSEQFEVSLLKNVQQS